MIMKPGFFIIVSMFFICCNNALESNEEKGATKEEKDITETRKVSKIESSQIEGLWKVDYVIQDEKKLKVKAYYFFGADSTHGYSPSPNIENELLDGYKYFVRNDTIYTANISEGNVYIYEDEITIILDLNDKKMKLKSINGDEIFLTRIK